MTHIRRPGTLGQGTSSMWTGNFQEATVVRPQTYEITFTGQASSTLCAEFDDCEVTVGRGTTMLRAELPDRGALSGLLQRITGFGLELIDLHIVAPPPVQ